MQFRIPQNPVDLGENLLVVEVRPGDDPGGAGGRLSPREREIAQLLAAAKTNKEVAQRLGVSVKTIDAHRANIMRKLNLHSVAELVRYAIREKLIEA